MFWENVMAKCITGYSLMSIATVDKTVTPSLYPISGNQSSVKK